MYNHIFSADMNDIEFKYDLKQRRFGKVFVLVEHSKRALRFC